MQIIVWCDLTNVVLHVITQCESLDIYNQIPDTKCRS